MSCPLLGLSDAASGLLNKRQLASSKKGAVTAAVKIPATLPPMTMALLASLAGAAAAAGALAAHTGRSCARGLRGGLATTGSDRARASEEAKYLPLAIVTCAMGPAGVGVAMD